MNYDRTIRTRVYQCVNSKCNWSGKQTNFIYQGGGKRRVCPMCMSQVERMHTEVEQGEEA